MSAFADAQLSQLHQALGSLAPRFDAEVLAHCDSTNSLLLQRAQAGAASGSVLWALEQHAGRGRRGRSWIAHGTGSLCFSLLWRFEASTALAGLSLAVGLAVVQALEGLGARGLGLKWPNDLWLDGRKLGGILVELQQNGARCAAVIGIGLNLQAPPAALLGELRPAALNESVSPLPPRSELLAAILSTLLDTLETFSRLGFVPFQQAWMQRHALQGQAVELFNEHSCSPGICLGVDTAGALLLEQQGRVTRVVGGEVSLRRSRA